MLTTDSFQALPLSSLFCPKCRQAGKKAQMLAPLALVGEVQTIYPLAHTWEPSSWSQPTTTTIKARVTPPYHIHISLQTKPKPFLGKPFASYYQ